MPHLIYEYEGTGPYAASTFGHTVGVTYGISRLEPDTNTLTLGTIDKDTKKITFTDGSTLTKQDSLLEDPETDVTKAHLVTLTQKRTKRKQLSWS